MAPVLFFFGCTFAAPYIPMENIPSPKNTQAFYFTQCEWCIYLHLHVHVSFAAGFGPHVRRLCTALYFRDGNGGQQWGALASAVSVYAGFVLLRAGC